MNRPIQNGTRVSTALLLAAGTGSRLHPLTNSIPKCLTEVSGIPMLERLLDCLHEHKFKRLVVVLGHLEEHIRKYLALHAGDLIVDYVVSPVYRTTNNIYSLWLAREAIQEPFLLIESDLIFDAPLLEKMLYPNRMAVSKILPWMNGTTVTADASLGLTAFQLGSKSKDRGVRYKTVNIYSLSLASWRRIGERLDQYIRAGRVNEYYEAVFAEMTADGSLSFQCVMFDNARWYEVDTLEDLSAAELLFPIRRKGALAFRNNNSATHAPAEVDHILPIAGMQTALHAELKAKNKFRRAPHTK
jgi:NDP-sugar pyrophosphorylase family protein